MSWPNYCLPT